MKTAIAALAVMAVAGAAPLMARQAGFSAGESGFSSQVRAGFLAAGRQAGLFRAAARKASAERRVNALVQYAADGNLPMMKALLAQGVDVNAKSDYGPAALSAAAVNNRAEVVRYLLDRGADPNAAARHPSPGYYGDASGVAPLMLIASNRIFDVRMAFDLLAHGAAVDARDSLGDTALMYAAQGGAVSAPDAGSHLDLIKLLLAHHADVNARNKPGLTALMWVAAASGFAGASSSALASQRIGIARYLIAAGADVNAVNAAGASALNLAEGPSCVKSPMTELIAAHGGKRGSAVSACKN